MPKIKQKAQLNQESQTPPLQQNPEPLKKISGLLPAEIVEKIILDHEKAIDDRMGHLYNRFIGYIAEAKIPIPQVITVLNLLLNEALSIAELKYKGPIRHKGEHNDS